MASVSIPPETRLSYSSSTASSVRNSTSPIECSQRRPVGRADIKDERPDPRDLYGIAGKYPSVEILKDILKTAAEEKNKIPLKRAQFRTGTQAYKKDELLARVLVYPYTRQLILDYLINYQDAKGKYVEIVDANADLSNFYLQFCEDGPVFPGDSPLTKELQLAAGIEYIEGKEKEDVKETSKTIKIPKALYSKVQEAINDTDGKVDKQRLLNLYKIVKVLASVEDEELQKLTEYVIKEYS